MATRSKVGRPQRPYETSWGEVVPGLARDTDGRWRIAATGKRFTEPDERRAVARFLADHQPETVRTPTTVETALPKRDENGMFSGPIVVKPQTKAEDYWPWLREQLIERPEYIAKMTGIPEVANLRHLPIPKASLTIAKIIEAYERDNPSTAATKRRVVATFRRLAKFAGARTLDDLTQEKLTAWRAEIESDPKLTSAGTRVGMYGHPPENPSTPRGGAMGRNDRSDERPAPPEPIRLHKLARHPLQQELPRQPLRQAEGPCGPARHAQDEPNQRRRLYRRQSGHDRRTVGTSAGRAPCTRPPRQLRVAITRIDP